MFIATRKMSFWKRSNRLDVGPLAPSFLRCFEFVEQAGDTVPRARSASRSGVLLVPRGLNSSWVSEVLGLVPRHVVLVWVMASCPP